MNKIIKIPFARQKKRLKSTIETLCMTCMLLVGSSSCSKEPIEIPFDVIEIPFLGYSVTVYPSGSIFIERIQGFWEEKLNKGRVTIVNSSEELGKCIPDNYKDIGIDYPDIDFFEHSLLLACGTTSLPSVDIISLTLYKKSFSKYTLNVKVANTEVAVASGNEWATSILIPKIKNETTIALKIDEIKN